jgi:tripartite-type tricarboxylate transporter receptor subunit TctC
MQGKSNEEGAKMKGKLVFSIAAILALCLAANAHPQAYPTKPVMLLVAYPAGGATDIGARIVASIAEKELGQPIVVVNKGGAGGQVGFMELSKQKPDGYYIGFINLPSLNTMVLDPDFKAAFTMESFTPIINQVLDPGIAYVRGESRYTEFKDLIADAKKRPGEVKVGVTGILGDDHLALLMMEKAAGVKFRMVVFEGDAPQITAILGGQIDCGFLNVAGQVPKVKGGQLRALAVMDKERVKFFPDVPTMVELGYPTIISSSTRGIAGPKGMPEAIVKKLQDVFKKTIDDPRHREKMDQTGLAIKIMVGEEYRKYMMDFHEKLRPLVEQARKER